MILWERNCGRVSGDWLISASHRVSWAAQLGLRIQDSLTHVCGICCWLLAGALQSPPYWFCLHMVSHARDSLFMRPVLQEETGLPHVMASFQGAKEKLQDLLRPRPGTHSSRDLPPDFLLYEKNKLLNVWTILMGYSLLWLSNSFWLQC